MQIGIMPPLTTPLATPEYITRVARAAEERGFHSLWAPEHVVLFDEYASRYPYSEDGRLAAGGRAGILDPFQALTFAAAVTSTIRLGTGIVLVPQRNPVYTAKAVASLDWLSGGRFDFGVGIGWPREEFEALEVPWKDRAGRTADYIEVMRRLWRDEVASFEGTHYTLRPARQFPKPVQSPHPPIYFGGESDAALRRVAAIGDGWYGFYLDPERAQERLATLDGYLAEAGRSRADVRILVSPYRRAATPAMLEAFAALGVQEVVVVAGARDADAMIARMDGLAAETVEFAAAL